MTHLKCLAVALLMVGVACDKKQSVPTPATPTPKTSKAISPATAPESQPSSPMDQLQAMDPRTPVPLQPMMAWHQKQNMQQHLVAISDITQALSLKDWAALEKAASTIGTSPQMTQMCKHMGAGAPGFTELALSFHQEADGIKAAAQAKDAQAVLVATTATLKVCTSCHAAYKQDVVDAETWTKRTGSMHSPQGH